jgi:signal transduction histidine kinase/ligand-binding sensor domain-containing protein
VGTGGDGLHTMNRETGKFTRHTYDPANPNKLSRPPLGDPNSDLITFIKEDYQGNIWIGTDQNGLNVYDPVKKTITHYGEEVDNGVWWMYVSADNQIWITTNQNRLLKVTLDYTPLPGYFGQFRRKYVESDSVRWFGTDNGLIKEIQSGTNSTMQFYPIPSQGPDYVIKNWNSFTDEPISVDLLLPLIKNTDGKILYRKNLSVETRIFDPQTGKISAFENDTLGLSNFNISQILQESDSVYWIGSWDYGLMKVDLKNKVTQRFQNDPTNGRSLCSNTILHLQTDIEGNIWVATFNGLQRYNRETNDFSSFLLSTIISQILTDSQGVLWIATLNGLFYYDPLNKQFKLSPINGSIYSGFEDTKDSSLYFGADNGVYKLNASRQYISFFEKEAKNETTLINNNYWTFSEAYRLNSRIFIGSRGTSGIGKYFVFDPDKLVEPISGSMPYISGLWLNEEMVEPGPNSPIHSAIEQLKSLKLANDQNIFSVSFGTIDFQDRYDDQIYYMLEGFDLDWKKTKPNDRIRFFKIPTGKYLLKIKTPNPNGKWNEKNLEVLIAPPFYLNAWAYGFYFLFLCAGVYIIHKTQKARVLRKERERIKDRELLQAKEIEKAYTELKVTQSQLIHSEKMASLGELTAGIAHEIQNPLNFVNNFSEVSKELVEEFKNEKAKGKSERDEALEDEILNDISQNLEKINHHGKRASDIVKGMLQHSRTSSGQKEPTDINALADEYLRLAYHGLRAKDKSFNAEFVTDFDESLPKINVIPQDIGRVLLNLINNAFYAVDKRAKENVEGYKPEIVVSTSSSPLEKGGIKGGLNGVVTITVSDNGPGIPSHIVDKIFQPFFTTKPTGQGTGLGLSLSYDIVKAHGGELKVETKEMEGSEFIIQLPII